METRNRVADAFPATSDDFKFDLLDDLEIDVVEDGNQLTEEELSTVVEMLKNPRQAKLNNVLWSILEALPPKPEFCDLAIEISRGERSDNVGAVAYLHNTFPSVFANMTSELINSKNPYIQFEAAISLLPRDLPKARSTLQRLTEIAPYDLVQRAEFELQSLSE